MTARLLLSGVAFIAIADLASAQGNPPSPYPMPGTIVSRPSLAPVGTRLPNAAPKIGTPVGYTGPDGQPINPGQRPAGQIVNLNNLSAPLVAPLPTDLTGAKPKTYLEQLFDKWKATFGFGPPAVTPPQTWTPGISRRNRDRKDSATAWQRN
jgi:hypothetical protein